jgi:hypothetical protein
LYLVYGLWCMVYGEVTKKRKKVKPKIYHLSTLSSFQASAGKGAQTGAAAAASAAATAAVAAAAAAAAAVAMLDRPVMICLH